MSPPKKTIRTTRPSPAKRATSFEPEVAEAFGAVVRAERQQQAVAQDQFALHANVDRSYFGKLERGERQPSLALILRVAGGLGCSGAELVARTEKLLAGGRRGRGAATAAPAKTPRGYPPSVTTAGQRMLYQHLGKDASLALRVDQAVRESLSEGWRDHAGKVRKVRHAIRCVLNTVLPLDQGLSTQEPGTKSAPSPPDLDAETDRVLALVRAQPGY